jgi:MFS family permease
MNRSYWVLLCLLSAAVLLRLPMILGDNFVLDGDEAIVALMSLEALEDGVWRPLFWGQNYGFVLPEILTTLPFISLFGMNAFTTKLPMLLWFLLGAGAVYGTLGRFTSSTPRVLLTLLVLLAPTWLLWSVRLRGGYVPAFAIAHVVIYLSVMTYEMRLKRGALIGLLLGFTFILQAIWFPGAACFALVAWWRSGRKVGPFLLAAVAMVIPYLLLIPFQVEEPFHQPPFFQWDADVIAFNASVYISYLERGMQGLHLHGRAFRELMSANTFSIGFLLLTLVVLGAGLRRLLTEKKLGYLEAAIAAILGLLLWSFFLGSAAPRYALPMFGYVILALGMLWPKQGGQWLTIVVLSFVGLGTHTLINGHQVKYEDITRSATHELINKLAEEEVELVFTENYLLQWQLMYYTDGKVLARSLTRFDRRPDRMEKAEEIFANRRNRTALVDFRKDARFDPDWSNREFSVRIAPKPEFLYERGFREL